MKKTTTNVELGVLDNAPASSAPTLPPPGHQAIDVLLENLLAVGVKNETQSFGISKVRSLWPTLQQPLGFDTLPTFNNASFSSPQTAPTALTTSPTVTNIPGMYTARIWAGIDRSAPP
ncbi:hypothetical protein MY4038_007636 [Beauveria bassiana]